jgi:hypothetical protein
MLLADHAIQSGYRESALLGQQLGLELVVHQRVELALVEARDEEVALVHAEQADLAQAKRIGEAHLSGSPPAV